MSKKTANNKLGFNLIEMMLVIIVFLLFISVIMIFFNSQQANRRDIVRLYNVSQLEKALEVYVSETGSYPEGEGCITGSDSITKAFLEYNIFPSDVVIGDPSWISDSQRCYFYSGSGSTYSLRFYLETDDTGKGNKGQNTISP